MREKTVKPPPLKEEMTPFERMRELLRRVVNVPKDEAVGPKQKKKSKQGQ